MPSSMSKRKTYIILFHMNFLTIIPFLQTQFHCISSIRSKWWYTTHQPLAFLPTNLCACCQEWSIAKWGNVEFNLMMWYQRFQMLCEIGQAKNKRDKSSGTSLQNAHNKYCPWSWICLFCRFTFVGILSKNILHNKNDTFGGF